MMRSKREEPFRYTFKQPVNAFFEIIRIGEQTVSTAKGQAEIIDLSPHGMKLSSHLKIPKTEHKSIQLSIAFELNDKQINVKGIIVWKKDKGHLVDYGIDLIPDAATEKTIIEQLKIYAKNIDT